MKQKPRNAKTGYALQTERLLYTGKDGMRSFKIPLKNENKEVFNSFVNKVKSDYIAQVGNVNLSDWYQNQNDEVYSLADFWLDSLRAGVIFSKKSEEIKILITKINNTGTKFDKFKAILSESHSELNALVDVNALFLYLTSGGRPGDKTEDQLFSAVRNTLFPNFRKVENSSVDNWTKKFYKAISLVDRKQLAIDLVGFDISSDVQYDHTFFIHPKISFSEVFSPKELIAKYVDFLINNKDLYNGGSIENNLKMILGFDNNHGAFSKYFNTSLKMFRENPDDIIKQIINVSDYWNKNQEELKLRVSFLSEKAKKIKLTQLGLPHEYISSFGGKFESWVSNYLRQEKEIKDQLFGFSSVDKRGNVSDKFTEGDLQVLEKIKIDLIISDQVKDLVDQCIEVINSLRNGISDNQLTLYRQLIGELRTLLNVEYQEKYPELIGKTEKEIKEDEKTKRAYRKYAQIYKDIKLVPNFLGDTKRKTYSKFIRSADILHEGITFIQSIDRQLPHEISHRFKDSQELIEFTEKIFQTLLSKYYTANNSRIQHIILGIIQERSVISLVKKEKGTEKQITDNTFSLNKLFIKQKGEFINSYYYTFFTHKKARDQRKIKIKLDFTENNVLMILNSLIKKLSLKWNEIISNNNFGEIIDAIEIEKIRLGIVVALYNEYGFGVNKNLLSVDLFESAHAFLNLQNNPATLSGSDLGRFLQALVLSEIKGAVNKMSRTEYIERYIAQPMKSEEKFPLAVNHEDKISWYITEKSQFDKSGDSEVEVKIGKDFTGKSDSYKKTRIDKKYLFSLISSKYHLQFLNKTLGGNGTFWWNKKKINFSLSSYSFIFEQKVYLKWDLKNKKLEIEKSNQSEDKNLFVSIPFNISPASQSSIGLEKRNRYMGIDVGEYGLAYTIIETDLKNIKINKIWKQGFIYEPLTHKVREYVTTIKDNQVKGTFGMPDTKLARLRENAITGLRNQVHDIAMRYNAKPVYEFEISNFETGSNKVKVIYDSVKRADVGRGGIDAEKAEADLVWGKNGKNFGSQIGAYATSYICTDCCYSPYLDFEQGNIDRDRLSEIKKLTRPSLEDFLIKYPKYKNNSELLKKGEKDGNWKTRRGNSAIYICQNCNHISDADIQASYWIAVKRFIKDISDKDDKKGKQVEIQEMIKFHKDSNFETLLNLDLL